MAASWDPETIERGQAVAAREARAVGIHWTFAPMVDIARDPRWGRIIEGAGEDPYLGAAVAAAQVRGFQGAELGTPERIIAGPKHFAGYGAALGGRDYDEVNLSDSELWNVVLPAVQGGGRGRRGQRDDRLHGPQRHPGDRQPVAVHRGAARHAGASRASWSATPTPCATCVTHGFAADLTDAGARARQRRRRHGDGDRRPRLRAPARGAGVRATVIERRSTRACGAILEAKLRLGLFDDPYVDEDRAREVLADPAHREVARVAAERSAVLLRNEGDLLPLDAGSLELDRGDRAAGRLHARHHRARGCFDFDLDETVTVLDGIRAQGRRRACGSSYARGVPRRAARVPVDVRHVRRQHARRIPRASTRTPSSSGPSTSPRDADVAVVVVGEWQNMIGEAASRSSLELPGRQLELLQAVVATGTPVVLLVMNGRPLDLRWAAEHVPAILDIWYPGTQGGAAVANLLFGDVSPGGKLPFTWPRTVGQVPMIYAHTTLARAGEPGAALLGRGQHAAVPVRARPELRPVRATPTSPSIEPPITTDGTVTVSVEVTNTGDREADEVVQLYLHQRYGTASRPVRELKGFQRVTLAAGRVTDAVSSRSGPNERRYWNAAARDWVHRRLDLRRLGRRRLHRRAGRHLRGHEVIVDGITGGARCSRRGYRLLRRALSSCTTLIFTTTIRQARTGRIAAFHAMMDEAGVPEIDQASPHRVASVTHLLQRAWARRSGVMLPADPDQTLFIYTAAPAPRRRRCGCGQLEPRRPAPH